MEEILDSIKKVIARDNRDGLIAERRRRAIGPTAQPAAEPADAEEAAEVLELGEEAMVALAQDEDEAEERYDAAQAEDTPVDALLREESREAMQRNFAALAMLARPGKQPQIVRSGETSLEGLVRDMLRPMLAQWLDANLPAMVEDMVKAEIARIAGKRS